MTDSSVESVTNTKEELHEAKPATRGRIRKKIRIYSHSQLFYFWPVWLTAICLWLLSLSEQPPYPEYYAPLMALVLFYVITATSISLRGIWFFFVSLILIIIGLLIYMGGVVYDILEFIQTLDLQVSRDFYKVLGIPLLLVWLLTTFIYDKLRYVELTRRQLTIVREVGDKHEDFDTIGMAFTKRRDNLAQHLFLGFGSGDLIIKPGMRGGSNESIRVNNILGIRKKKRIMDEILESNSSPNDS